MSCWIWSSVDGQQAPIKPGLVSPRFVVVIDAAHGGMDSGARLSDGLLEKDLTLALAERMRSALASLGVTVVATRESDATVSMLDRAQTGNHAAAGACITLHATASGAGVHLFTSSLAAPNSVPSPAAGPPASFQVWQTVQAAFIQQSLHLSSEINAALTAAEVPVTLGRISMQPLDSFACPAVVVEVAPAPTAGHAPGVQSAAVSDPAYQAKLAAVLAAAVVQFRNDGAAQPAPAPPAEGEKP